VQQALAQFLVLNPQKITVQSHSSVSKAGKTLTQEVLTQRAQAVENVLTENGTLTEDKVEAVGVGYDKSTANQANSKGSDRVDLLIQL
jgi:outer membrane protein OmpA-like peptidoglycan-associated protein